MDGGSYLRRELRLLVEAGGGPIEVVEYVGCDEESSVEAVKPVRGGGIGLI